MSAMLLKNARLDDYAEPQDLLLEDGKIAVVAPAGTLPADRASESLDCENRAVLPGFVETHLHLDKALLDERMPNLAGTLEGAIKVTGALKSKFEMDDVLARSRKVLDMAIAQGTTMIRTQPDVDPIVHTIGADAMLALRDEYRGRVDLQVVAFPQEGIIKAPGEVELLEECLRNGADVVGGCTYNEVDVDTCKEHIQQVFDLAEKYSVPVDMHCDFQVDDSDPRYALVEYIAGVTIERGMQGRVTLGHMTSLGALAGQHRVEVWDRIKQAEINIVVLPFTDMHLNARNDDHNVRRGIAPVKLMWDVDISVGISSNNVRNAFTPFGNADLMDVALFLAQVGHMGSPDDFRRLMRTITYANAKIVGIDAGYGTKVGDRADLVVLDAPDSPTGLLDRAVRTAVIKGGQIVARTEKTTQLFRR
ncbi:MAG: amidohydrolase family protein [Cellulomonas sp.]